MHRKVGIVQLAAIMGKSVGNNQVISTEYAVVGRNLIENLLCDSHFRRFIFNDQAGTACLAMVEDGVTSPRHSAYVQLDFVCQ